MLYRDMYGGTYGTIEYRETHQTPDYWGKVSRHEYLSPLEYFTTKVEVDASSYLYPSGATGSLYEIDGAGFWLPGQALSRQPGYWAVEDELKRKVANNICSQARDVNIEVGVVFGEANKTLSFVQDGLSSVARAANAARKRDFRKAYRLLSENPRYGKDVRKISKNVSDNYLKYTFGVRPLLMDIHGGLQTFDDQYWNALHKLYRWYSTANGHFEFGSLETPDPRWYDGYKLKTHISARDTVTGICTNIAYRNLDSLGVTNPLSTAYEMFPFSWLVDSFIPLKSYLQSLVPPLGYEIRSYVRTFKRRSESYGHRRYDGGVPAYHRYSESLFERRNRPLNFNCGVTLIKSPTRTAALSCLNLLHILNIGK